MLGYRQLLHFAKLMYQGENREIYGLINEFSIEKGVFL
jgi:hypothetical protein